MASQCARALARGGGGGQSHRWRRRRSGGEPSWVAWRHGMRLALARRRPPRNVLVPFSVFLGNFFLFFRLFFLVLLFLDGWRWNGAAAREHRETWAAVGERKRRAHLIV